MREETTSPMRLLVDFGSCPRSHLGAAPWPYANLRLANNGFGGLPEGGRPLRFGSDGATTGGARGAVGAGGGATDGLWDVSGAGCAFFLGAVRCATAFPLPLGTGKASFNRVFFPAVLVT